MNQRKRHHRSMRRSAFTMIECLLGLAITAVLLTAVAVAFNASLTNFQENERMYQTVNSARQALTRMTTQLRTAESVDPAAPLNECALQISAAEFITYQYRSADKTLYLVKDDGTEYVLCNNVTAATFTKTPTSDGMAIKSVQILLTVEDGDYKRTLSAAAVIRKNLGLE
jgi:prepilin-type N-terminal cleavage/methylation domain-containing protein